MNRLLPLLLLATTTAITQAAGLIAPSSGSYVNPTSDIFVPFPFPQNTTTTHTVPDNSLGTVSVTNVINGSGLSGVPTISDYTTITHTSPSFSGGSANAWSSIDPGIGGGDFFSDFASGISNINPQNTPAGYFDLRFDTPVNLTDFVTWAYTFGSGFNGNNVSQWTIQTFNLDGDFIGGGDFDGPSSMLNGGATTISFGTTYNNVSSVQAWPLDNYFGSVGAFGGDRIGVAELRFITANTVPEPSVSAVGLLTLGLLASRRRRA
jgi:MYXO-CTERM domain-containing protein